MKEIHEIQEKIYEEMKNMTDKEKIEAIRKEAEDTKKQYGIKLKKASYVR